MKRKNNAAQSLVVNAATKTENYFCRICGIDSSWVVGSRDMQLRHMHTMQVYSIGRSFDFK